MTRFASMAATAGLCVLSGALATGQDKKPHTFSVGDVVQASVTVKVELSAKESGSKPKADVLEDANRYRFEYLERIDKVDKQGRATKITRHYLKARVLDSDEDKDGIDLDLEGRQVVLSISSSGAISGTWSDGSKLDELNLDAAQASLWPGSSAELQGHKGTKQGTLSGVSVDGTWPPKKHANLPGAVLRHMKEFPLTIRSGSWKVEASGKHAPTGKATVTLSLKGREEFSEKGKQVVHSATTTVKVVVEVKAPKAKTLPKPKAPPKNEK